MLWSKRLVVLVLPLTLTLNALGNQIQFGVGKKAELHAYPILSNDRSGINPVELRLSVPVIDLNDTKEGFQQLNVPGLTVDQHFGNPEVMVTGSLIAVPEGYTPILRVLSQKQEEVRDVVIRPCQQTFRCSVQQDGFQFNNALYRSATLYPSSVVALEEVGYLQNIHLMRVAINPVQQDFSNSSLKVTTELHVRVDFKQTGRTSTALVPASVSTLLNASTVNGSSLGGQIRTALTPEVIVVVVADSLKTAIAPYIQWKQQKGYKVHVATLTEAGGTKEAVKEYIQKFYDSEAVKPSFLLFVGNNTTMPTFYTTAGGQQAAGDYTYALLAGGATDPLPDVTFARLAADNEADVTTQISRWIAYEKNAKTESWYPQAMTIASNEGSGPSDKEYAQQIQEALKAGTYTKFDSFFQGEQTATAKNITEALGQGRTWLAYFGHGSGTSWGSTNDIFEVTQVDAQANVEKLPAIIDVACMNANWAKIQKSFGKAWVINEKQGKAAGAVAFYGGSVNISWHPPAIMSVGIAKTHYEKGVNILGNNVMAGQLYLVEKVGNNAQSIDNIKWYNLLGDPALSMRTDAPKMVNVKVKKDTGSRASVTVTVTDNTGKALENMMASVSKEERAAIAIGKTDKAGLAVLDLGSIGSLEGTLLTVTGYNTVTYQQALQ